MTVNLEIRLRILYLYHIHIPRAYDCSGQLFIWHKCLHARARACVCVYLCVRCVHARVLFWSLESASSRHPTSKFSPGIQANVSSLAVPVLLYIICARTHAHTNTHTHTQTHTHTPVWPPVNPASVMYLVCSSFSAPVL